MATINDCLLKLYEEGHISKETKEAFEKFQKQDPNLSEEDLVKKVKDGYDNELKTRQSKIKEDIENIKKTYDPNLSEKQNIQARLDALPGKGTSFDSVVQRIKSYKDDLFSTHADYLYKLRNKLINNPKKLAWIEDAVKYFHDSNPAGRSAEGIEIGKMLKTVINDLDKIPNIPKRDRNNLITHNYEAILKTTRDDFINAVKPLVTDSEENIGKFYDQIDNGQLDNLTELQFAGADHLLQYANTFGNDVWSSFMQNIERDLVHASIADVFGSKRVLNKLIETLPSHQQNAIKNQIKEIDGSINHDVSNGALATKISKGARDITGASSLGGATISSFTDTITLFATGFHNGMGFTKPILRSIQSLTNLEKDTKWLADQGIIANYLTDDLAGATRFDEYAGVTKTSVIFDKLLRASGLIHWTNALKVGWKKSFVLHLKELPADFKQINNHTKSQFEHYGITENHWNEFVNNNRDIKLLDNKLRVRFRRFINEESDYAVVEPTTYVKSIMHQGLEQGTVKGEAIRHIGQFKSFLAATWFTHVYRMFFTGTKMDRLQYSTAMFAASIPIGMFVVGAKDTIKGNNPLTRDYSKPGSWKAVFVESGLGGPAVEMIMSAFEKGKVDFAQTLAAPSLKIVNNIALKPAHYWMKHPDELNIVIGHELKGMASLIPGKNLWYTQAIVNSLSRKLMLNVNPDYEKVFNNYDRYMKNKNKEVGLQSFQF